MFNNILKYYEYLIRVLIIYNICNIYLITLIIFNNINKIP